MSFLRDLFISVAQKTHWERWVFPEPDKTKHLEKLAELTEKSPPPQPQTTALTSTVTPEEMLAYQKKDLYGQLWLLQGHLSNGSRIEGKPCDCAQKHALAVAALATETQPMDPGNPLYAEIRRFTEGILPKVEASKVIEGTYASEYPGMAAKARDLRKRIELGLSPLTLEVAKAEAAKLAQEEVERQWHSQENK